MTIFLFFSLKHTNKTDRDRQTDRQVSADIATADSNMKVTHTRPVCRLPVPRPCACAVWPHGDEETGPEPQHRSTTTGEKTGRKHRTTEGSNRRQPPDLRLTFTGITAGQKAVDGGRSTGSLPVSPHANGKRKRNEAAASAAF